MAEPLPVPHNVTLHVLFIARECREKQISPPLCTRRFESERAAQEAYSFAEDLLKAVAAATQQATSGSPVSVELRIS